MDWTTDMMLRALRFFAKDVEEFDERCAVLREGTTTSCQGASSRGEVDKVVIFRGFTVQLHTAASIYLFKPLYAIGSVPSVSGHAIAYRWRSLPRVHRHRASKPQGSSKRVLPWQVTMDQLICASLSHTH